MAANKKVSLQQAISDAAEQDVDAKAKLEAKVLTLKERLEERATLLRDSVVKCEQQIAAVSNQRMACLGAIQEIEAALAADAPTPE